MAMEVVCGNCQGRLLVEHTGVVVACPHCGAHLQIGEPTPPAAQVPPPVEMPPAPQVAPPQPEPVASSPAPSASPFADFNPEAFTTTRGPAAAPPAPPPTVSAPPPVFAPPPATPEFSPFPASFEPPAVAASNPPGPLFPEIVLTPPPATAPPPAPLVTPSAATAPEPVSAPAWEPPPQSGFPSQPTASDSWMPQINLEMPAAVATPAPVSEPAAAPVEPPPAPPLAVPETATTLSPAMPTVDASPSTVNLSPPPGGSPANQTDIWNPVRVEEPRAEVPTIGFPGAEPSFANFGNFSPTPVVQNAAPAAVPTFTPTPVQTTAPVPVQLAPTPVAPAAASSVPQIAVSNSRREATVPRVLFVIAASYASAMTIAFLYLYSRTGGDPLSLPDIRPPFNKKTGQYGLRLGPQSPLPPAFRLKLGESKRYGNLMVTPLKVTKGPLEFVHFGDEKMTKPPTQSPVLKLWIKFQNVSSDQTFPALDEELLFRRAPDREDPLQDRSNNYVCRVSEQKPKGKRVPVYTFPIKGDWLLKGQKLDTELGPDDEWETYIPSNDEDLSGLTGPLSWRVHFRKGYNPQSLWGVTTLIDVEFNSDEIQKDS